MRLARTAVSSTAQSAWLESNQRSPAPEAGGVPCSPTGRRSCSTPGGSRTRASRLRAGRHDRSTTGATKERIGGAGIEPAPARYQRAVPPRTPASDDIGSGGRIRTCASRVTVARLAARPHRSEPRNMSTRRGVRPRAVSLKGPGRIRTCTAPSKSRQLSPVELRSREEDVAGRIRTCGAPRFRRPLYRLSYGHMRKRAMGEAGIEPATSCV